MFFCKMKLINHLMLLDKFIVIGVGEFPIYKFFYSNSYPCYYHNRIVCVLQ